MNSVNPEVMEKMNALSKNACGGSRPRVAARKRGGAPGWHERRRGPVAAVLLVGLTGALAGGCNARSNAGASTGAPMGAERRIADAMYAVLSSDRAIYTREVVDRLQNKDKVISASEHFREEKLLPLPAQMLRMSAEEIRKKRHDFAVALLSPWPINRQNSPHTEVEKAGLEAVTHNPDQPFTGEETLGKDRYFTAVYADRAISDACVACHNKHEESPRHDFKLGDVLGGIVIRVAI
jgi:Protein of unknown function (DUF3365)